MKHAIPLSLLYSILNFPRFLVFICFHMNKICHFGISNVDKIYAAVVDLCFEAEKENELIGIR